MESCVDQETDEVADISESNTCSHPGTVMIMHLYTYSAVRAVEGAWRSHDLTGVTIGKNGSKGWFK